MENVNDENKVEEKKSDSKPGLSFYIISTILVLVTLSFLVEIYGAFVEGRPLNFELVNKLLDTLIHLLSSPDTTSP